MKKAMAVFAATALLATSAHATVYTFQFTSTIGGMMQSLNNGPAVAVTDSSVPNTNIKVGDSITGTFHYDDRFIYTGPTETTPSYTSTAYGIDVASGMTITNQRTGQATATSYMDAWVWDSHDSSVRPDAFLMRGSQSYYGGNVYEPLSVALDFDSTSADILNSTAMPGAQILLLNPALFTFEYSYVTDFSNVSTVTATGAITSLTLLPVPEPATYSMLAAGLGLLAWRRRYSR